MKRTFFALTIVLFLALLLSACLSKDIVPPSVEGISDIDMVLALLLEVETGMIHDDYNAYLDSLYLDEQVMVAVNTPTPFTISLGLENISISEEEYLNYLVADLQETAFASPFFTIANVTIRSVDWLDEDTIHLRYTVNYVNDNNFLLPHKKMSFFTKINNSWFFDFGMAQRQLAELPYYPQKELPQIPEEGIECEPTDDFCFTNALENCQPYRYVDYVDEILDFALWVDDDCMVHTYHGGWNLQLYTICNTSYYLDDYVSLEGVTSSFDFIYFEEDKYYDIDISTICKAADGWFGIALMVEKNSDEINFGKRIMIN